jgi:hypothetical protein
LFHKKIDETAKLCKKLLYLLVFLGAGDCRGDGAKKTDQQSLIAAKPSTQTWRR